MIMNSARTKTERLINNCSYAVLGEISAKVIRIFDSSEKIITDSRIAEIMTFILVDVLPIYT
jgi:hypothetical protein